MRVSLGLDDFHSGLEQMVGCCEHGCEHLSFILYYVGNLLILRQTGHSSVKPLHCGLTDL